MALEKVNLRIWKFALGEEIACLQEGREVCIPHTWNIEEGTEEYWGTGWYEASFMGSENWKGKRIRVLFHAVYHDAYVYLNGKEVGAHKNSGYTPFIVELTDHIKYGEDNHLMVKADNRFSKEMLPFDTSFDWANDGGLIRPVELLVTGESFLKHPAVTASPVITTRKERQEEEARYLGSKVRLTRKNKSSSALNGAFMKAVTKK